MVDINILKNIRYLSSCSMEEIHEVSRISESIMYKDNREIYNEGDQTEYLYLIIEGSIDMYIEIENDKVMHVSNLTDGDMFGAGELFYDTYYLSTITTSKSTLARIKKRDFFTKLLALPGINRLIMTDFANIIKLAVVHNKYFYGINRILLYLHHCCQEIKPVDDKCTLDKSITIEKIASSLNLTREHVSRMISELKKRSLVEKSGNRLIVNLTQLMSMIEYDTIYEKIKF